MANPVRPSLVGLAVAALASLALATTAAGSAAPFVGPLPPAMQAEEAQESDPNHIVDPQLLDEFGNIGNARLGTEPARFGFWSQHAQ